MVLEMLKFGVIEKKVLDALLVMTPKAVAEKMNIPVKRVYGVKSYFRTKIQNAEEFLSVGKSLYKPLLSRRLSSPKIIPVNADEDN